MLFWDRSQAGQSPRGGGHMVKITIEVSPETAILLVLIIWALSAIR